MPRDHELLWIAREGVRAPLPAPWDAVRSGEHEYFANLETGESMWEHPCDGEYMRLARVEQGRLARRARAREDDDHSAIESFAEPRGDQTSRAPRSSGASRFLFCFGLKPAHDNESAGPGALSRPDRSEPILRDDRISPRLFAGDLVDFFDELTEAWCAATRDPTRGRLARRERVRIRRYPARIVFVQADRACDVRFDEAGGAPPHVAEACVGDAELVEVRSSTSCCKKRLRAVLKKLTHLLSFPCAQYDVPMHMLRRRYLAQEGDSKAGDGVYYGSG